MHHYLVGTRDYDETKISKINSLQMLHVTVFKFYFDNKKNERLKLVLHNYETEIYHL